MKNRILIILLLVHSTLSAQTDSIRTLRIREVEVVAARPLKDIGLQRTTIDTTVLQQCVSLSMAEVLTQNSVIFIKSYGRATMATASFRGTAPSHTQVTWNGMKLNSPMLGMVDFSYIPAYFIDNANLLHGASSVSVSSGGLGGAVTLATQPTNREGIHFQYIQGISSFDTYDQFLRMTYARNRWKSSTRVLYATSQNDFPYTNYYKLKEPVYNADGEIIGQRYPTDRNKNCGFHDFHFLQEGYYNDGKGNRLGLSVWYMDSRRGVPKLNIDYRDDSQTEARQNENTLRAVGSWNRYAEHTKMEANAGYAYTDLQYLYLYDNKGDKRVEAIHSQSYTHNIFAHGNIEYMHRERWLINGNVTFNQYFVNSRDRSIVTEGGNAAIIGYDKARAEISGFLAARHKASERLGIALQARQDLYGNRHTPLIPAVFADYLLSKHGEVVLKASAARNFRYPTLNDLYFMPGGNPDLKCEKGYTYDGSLSFKIQQPNWNVKAEASAFDSHIHHWILWRPTFKGFWTPVNIKEVHSYGLELKGNATIELSNDWNINIDALYTITHSINRGDKASVNDASIGKQLPYIPVRSAAVTAKIAWQNWSGTYKWCHYGKRFTTSSNDLTLAGTVLPYYMSDLSIEYLLPLKKTAASIRFDIHNLFDETYETVLSHPMPGRNYGLFLGVKF